MMLHHASKPRSATKLRRAAAQGSGRGPLRAFTAHPRWDGRPAPRPLAATSRGPGIVPDATGMLAGGRSRASAASEGCSAPSRQRCRTGVSSRASAAVTNRQLDCGTADRNLADLESAIAGKTPALSAPRPTAAFAGSTPPAAPCAAPAIALGPLQSAFSPPAKTATGVAPARTAVATAIPSVPAPSPVSPLVQGNIDIPARGVTDNEIRFGISAPFSGATKELGHHMNSRSKAHSTWPTPMA